MRIEAQSYVDRIRESFLGGDDSKVASILEELFQDQDLTMEVWSVFPASMRRMLKEIQVQYRDKR